MRPILSADAILASPIERHLNPPNQQSLTREDKGVHCFSLDSLIVYPIVGHDRGGRGADPPRPIWSFAFSFFASLRSAEVAGAEGAARASTSFESSLISL
jgi:hypothetical protein